MNQEQYEYEVMRELWDERTISVNPVTGYAFVAQIGGRKGKTKYLHHLIAEKAIGKELRKGAVVHHIDGNRLNNATFNLVVCDSHSYHMMIHRRQRAFDATGDANSVLCEYCGNYGAEKERLNRPQIGWHYDCKRIYERASYIRRKEAKNV